MRSMMIPAAALAVLMACTPAQTERRSGADGGAETGMSGDAAGGLSTHDTATSGTATGDHAPSLSGIFSRLELANTAEIQVSKLGASQARSSEVKQIAQQLVTEHTKNRSELEALAKKKGVDVLAPAGGNTARDTSGVLALKGLEGGAFDSAFVKAQIEAHQANLDAIQNQMLPAAQDQDLRQYLEKTQAAMQKHLASLQQIQGQLKS
jgi:putative membrane protein